MPPVKVWILAGEVSQDMKSMFFFFNFDFDFIFFLQFRFLFFQSPNIRPGEPFNPAERDKAYFVTRLTQIKEDLSQKSC